MNQIIFYILVIFLTFLPFHPFLVTWSSSPYVSLLRDLFVLIFFFSGLFWRWKKKKPLIADELDWAIILFGLYFLLSYLFISHELLGLFYSLRYSFLPWLVLWSLRNFIFSLKQQKNILVTSIFIFGLIGIFGLVQAYLLPTDFLLKFGYTSFVAIGQGIWEVSSKLPAHQYIPSGLARIQSALSGPIQMAVYLLVNLGLLIAFWKNLKTRWLTISLFIFGTVILIFTFSRSAWIGFVLMLVLYLYTLLKKKGVNQLKFSLVIGLLLLIGLVSVFKNNNQFIDSSILRPSSSAEHQASISRIWAEREKIGFWGRGVGLSGPASLRLERDQRRAVENSYLRTYEELGIIGLILLLYLLLTLISLTLNQNHQSDKFSQQLKFGAGLGLVGVMAASLFTDSLTEPIPLLILAVYLALSLNQKKLSDEPKRISVFNIPLDRLDQKQVLSEIDQAIQQKQKLQIATVNSEFLVEALVNSEFRQVLQKTDLNTADGIGVIAASEYNQYHFLPFLKKIKILLPIYFLLSTFYFLLLGLLTGLRLVFAHQSFQLIPERVTGADLTLKLCQLSQKNKHRLFFLGGPKEADHQTSQILKKRFPETVIVGNEYGGKVSPQGIPDDKNLISRINNSKPDIIFVAFGYPKEEIFIDRYKNDLNASVMIGVGASIDFLLGTKKRAPLIWQKFSLEWLWRLFQESKRYKRIFKAAIQFPWLVFKSKII